MKRFPTLMIVLAAAFAMVATAGAQAAGPKGGVKPGEGRARLGARLGPRALEARKELFAKLNLTKAQQDRVQALDKKTGDSVREILQKARANGQKPDQATREKVQAIMKNHRLETEKILTKEQSAKLKELVKARREEMRKKRQAGGEATKK